MDKKLTDSEIVKALPFLAKYCKDEYNDIRVDEVLLGAFDLINRQNAKIDTLQKQVRVIGRQVEKAKIEAYKLFAERLKERYTSVWTWDGHEEAILVLHTNLDNLLKELVGEDK